MSLFERLRHRQKDQRFIIAGLTVLLLVFTALFYTLQRGRQLPAELLANRVLLFVLWYANVILILAILFVLLRNVFKLVVERHNKILGSTFKLKLVATYVGLSLIPVLLLFAIASELLQGSIDRWFSTPMGTLLERGNTVSQALFDRAEQGNLREAEEVRDAIAGLDLYRPGESRLPERLLAELNARRLDLVAVYAGTDFVHAAVNPGSGLRDLPEPGREFLEEAMAEGEVTRVTTPPGARGRLVLAAAAAPPAPAVERGVVPGGPVVVVVATVLEPALAEDAERLIQDFQSYRRTEVQKDDLRASHLLIFLMVTLLILLASSWVGLYLARRVTVPIQALAEGTRRISGGDLSHRVDVAADDELGVLVDSFNRMTAELESSKGQLERGNRELLEANRRLAEERAVIAAVLANVTAGVVSIDSAGTIFTANGAALHMLRQCEEEVVGRPAAEAWDDSERGKLLSLLEEPGGKAVRELHLVLGGEWKTFEVKVSALAAADGRVRGRVMVIEDLTELIQAQQLAAWNEAARRIAHEIKNPLTPIRLAAERALKKYHQNDPGLGAALEQGVETIVREVTTLQEMVDEFSRYARMPRPRPAPVEVARLIGDTVHLYRNLKPGVAVATVVEEGMGAVWLDGEQIRRALINLIDNAVEATDAPGEVTVSASRADGRLSLQVADTGRGIPREQKEKLFLPYFSTKGRGTGLGLAIVHRIVTDHLGSIRVEDNQPRGTVFTIELPAG